MAALCLDTNASITISKCDCTVDRTIVGIDVAAFLIARFSYAFVARVFLGEMAAGRAFSNPLLPALWNYNIDLWKLWFEIEPLFVKPSIKS